MEEVIRVLVIEDNPTDAELVERALVKDGFVVSTAATGTEGLRLAAEVNYSVVLVDLILPDMDGFAVLAGLAELDARPAPLRLMLTGYDDTEVMARALRLGAAYSLDKSHNPPADLGRRIRRWLEEEAADSS